MTNQILGDSLVIFTRVRVCAHVYKFIHGASKMTTTLDLPYAIIITRGDVLTTCLVNFLTPSRWLID